MVAFAFDPSFYLFFRTFDIERFTCAKHFDQFGKLGGTVFLPAFFACLFIIFRRSDEEERAKIPQVLDKGGTVFHHGYDLLHIDWVCFHAVAFEDRHKEGSGFLIVHSLDIMMVEPFSLFIIKFGSALAATAQIEAMDQFVHAHYFLIITRIPSQQGQEVDNRFGQVTALAITRRNLTALRVMPFQREHREAQAVTVTLAQLAVAFRFQKQSQVCEPGHRVFPSEITVQQYVKRGTRQPFFTTDHVRHFHQMIVHDIGQMVSGQLVG